MQNGRKYYRSTRGYMVVLVLQWLNPRVFSDVKSSQLYAELGGHNPLVMWGVSRKHYCSVSVLIMIKYGCPSVTPVRTRLHRSGPNEKQILTPSYAYPLGLEAVWPLICPPSSPTTRSSSCCVVSFPLPRRPRHALSLPALLTYTTFMLQQVFYLDVAHISQICCKCFIWMLHMFHTHIASVFSRCCICFSQMSQQYVSFVSNAMHPSVFMLQVFHGGTLIDGRMTRASGNGSRQSWGPADGGRCCNIPVLSLH
jgi:hypothetical protein